MKNLFNSFNIKNVNIKNRICVPPMVCNFGPCDNGEVLEKKVEHYRAIAKGGAGLIIQEATCVNKDGRLAGIQSGIWEDEQIPALKKVVAAVHEEGCPIFAQIHHAGVVGISASPLCPSAYEYERNGNKVTGVEMTLEDIHSVQKDFIEAGRRAYEAGYDGVELHGCHGYLICQFFNKNVNKRTDEYGLHKEKFAAEIIEGIRRVTSKDFVVGVRLGAFEPTLEDGIKHAKLLEEHGVDFLSISYGFQGEQELYVPEGYGFKDVIYAAKKIKEAVSIPTFAVNSIISAEMAEDVLADTKVEMVCIGRGILVNYNWAKDAEVGKVTGKCLHCKGCKWFVNPELCPGKILFNKQA